MAISYKQFGRYEPLPTSVNARFGLNSDACRTHRRPVSWMIVLTMVTVGIMIFTAVMITTQSYSDKNSFRITPHSHSYKQQQPPSASLHRTNIRELVTVQQSAVRTGPGAMSSTVMSSESTQGSTTSLDAAAVVATVDAQTKLQQQQQQRTLLRGTQPEQQMPPSSQPQVIIEQNSSVSELSNKNVIPSSSTSSITGSIVADQRYESQYRDDPITEQSASTDVSSNVLAKVRRERKLVFDRVDLETTKMMRIDKDIGCGELDGGYADLLVMVISAVHNFEARSAIRDTWGKFAKERGAYLYFLIGSTDERLVQTRVEAEDARFGDILQGSFFDSYHNLTLKTMSMMHWVGQRCSKIRYALKVDDDMMINMQYVADFSEVNPNFHKVIIGRLAKHWQPHRNRASKWFLPYEAFNGTRFPNFVTGPAYFFTGDAAKSLYETAYNDQAPFYLEDVYMTGVVAEKAGIKRFNHGLILNTHQNVTSCTFPKMMTSHKHTPAEIRRLWHSVYHVRCVKPPTAPTAKVANKKKIAQKNV